MTHQVEPPQRKAPYSFPFLWQAPTVRSSFYSVEAPSFVGALLIPGIVGFWAWIGFVWGNSRIFTTLKIEIDWENKSGVTFPMKSDFCCSSRARRVSRLLIRSIRSSVIIFFYKGLGRLWRRVYGYLFLLYAQICFNSIAPFLLSWHHKKRLLHFRSQILLHGINGLQQKVCHHFLLLAINHKLLRSSVASVTRWT